MRALYRREASWKHMMNMCQAEKMYQIDIPSMAADNHRCMEFISG